MDMLASRAALAGQQTVGRANRKLLSQATNAPEWACR